MHSPPAFHLPIRPRRPPPWGSSRSLCRSWRYPATRPHSEHRWGRCRRPGPPSWSRPTHPGRHLPGAWAFTGRGSPSLQSAAVLTLVLVNVLLGVRRAGGGKEGVGQHVPCQHVGDVEQDRGEQACSGTSFGEEEARALVGMHRHKVTWPRGAHQWDQRSPRQRGSPESGHSGPPRTQRAAPVPCGQQQCFC